LTKAKLEGLWSGVTRCLRHLKSTKFGALVESLNNHITFRCPLPTTTFWRNRC